MKALNAAIYTQLSTPATTLYGLVGARVYDLLAPPNAAFPFVVYQHQAGGDQNMEPVDRLDMLYMVKSFAGSLSSALAIDDAARDRLHKQALTVSGWTCLSVVRENEIALSEVVNGAPIFQVGALYRIRLARA